MILFWVIAIAVSSKYTTELYEKYAKYKPGYVYTLKTPPEQHIQEAIFVVRQVDLDLLRGDLKILKITKEPSLSVVINLSDFKLDDATINIEIKSITFIVRE